MVTYNNDLYLYYDSIDDYLIPKIYRVPIDGSVKHTATVFKNDAYCPVVSVDNTIFAYNYSHNASFSDNTKWQTIIEKDEKKNHIRLKTYHFNERDGKRGVCD